MNETVTLQIEAVIERDDAGNVSARSVAVKLLDRDRDPAELSIAVAGAVFRRVCADLPELGPPRSAAGGGGRTFVAGPGFGGNGAPADGGFAVGHGPGRGAPGVTIATGGKGGHGGFAVGHGSLRMTIPADSKPEHPAPWRWDVTQGLVDANGAYLIRPDELGGEGPRSPIAGELIRLAPEMDALLRDIYEGSRCPVCYGTADHEQACELVRILAALDAARAVRP